MTIELSAVRLAPHDLDELALAVGLIEKASLASRLTHAIGGRVESLGRAVPGPARRTIALATEGALKVALRIALRSLGPDEPDAARPRKASNRWHKAAAAATGAIGGAFGFAALAVELPISTTILLRSIADIARAEGEDLSSAEARIACIEVFALGGQKSDEVALEGGYLAMRATLAQSVHDSARFLVRSRLAGETAPAVIRMIPQVASRFGLAVSEKVAAQAIPILGAVGGAAINTAFADHFQSLARGHFIVRRLERKYGPDAIRFEYRRLQGALRSGAAA